MCIRPFSRWGIISSTTRLGLAPAAHSTNANAVATTDAIAAIVAHATDAIPTVVRHPRPVIAAVVAHPADAIPAVVAAIAIAGRVVAAIVSRSDNPTPNDHDRAGAYP